MMMKKKRCIRNSVKGFDEPETEISNGGDHENASGVFYKRDG